LLEAPQAFSLAALSYILIKHVPCCAPQAPTHALKSAAPIYTRLGIGALAWASEQGALPRCAQKSLRKGGVIM